MLLDVNNKGAYEVPDAQIDIRTLTNTHKQHTRSSIRRIA